MLQSDQLIVLSSFRISTFNFLFLRSFKQQPQLILLGTILLGIDRIGYHKEAKSNTYLFILIAYRI